MSESSWQQTASSYRPTVLLGRLPENTMQAAIAELSEDGWDVRIAPYGEKNDGDADTAALAAAACSIQPDLLVAAGGDHDPWAFEIIRQIRSNPATSDIGLVVLASVSVPDDLEVTPMSGPDRWIFGDRDGSAAVDEIREVLVEALEDRLEWARRDWMAMDRRHQGMKSLRLRIDQGEIITAPALAEVLYGGRGPVDTRVWEGPPHPPGWRYGAEDLFQRPLLVQAQKILRDDGEFAEQQFTLFSRSARLIIAAAHAITELSGGWPSIE